jgi:hypothetical protein
MRREIGTSFVQSFLELRESTFLLVYDVVHVKAGEA